MPYDEDNKPRISTLKYEISTFKLKSFTFKLKKKQRFV